MATKKRRQGPYKPKTAPANISGPLQKPMLDLLMRNLDSKGKQAKLKSPQELQDLLDVTRLLLSDFDDRQKYPIDTPEQKNDLDEVREKFRIVKVDFSTQIYIEAIFDFYSCGVASKPQISLYESYNCLYQDD